MRSVISNAIEMNSMMAVNVGRGESLSGDFIALQSLQLEGQ